MRVPGLHKLIKRPGRDRGRHRRGRPAAQNHWQLAGSVAAVVTLAALATAQLPDRPATGGSDAGRSRVRRGRGCGGVSGRSVHR